MSSVLVVAYLAFSVPAVLAGAVVTQLGLHETADIYGIGLIALAAVALGLARHLQDPQSEAPEPGEGSSAGAIAADG